MRKERRIRSWFLAIFGLPFFAVGLFFIYQTAVSVVDVMQMASWQQTPGTLISAELSHHHSDDSTTYKAEAQYRYRVNGIEYSGDRVAIHGGSDNIGDFQQQLGRQLQRLYRNQKPVTVYYNPSDPNQAVINRDLRWGMIGFNAIFIIVFGGAGLGLIIFGLRGKRVIDTPEAVDKPWLARPEWADNRILSGARLGMYLFWGFTIFWNALSIPAAIAVPEVWRKEGALALLILLFPLIGMGLFYWTVKQTLEWRRFGYTPLTMDPFPGAIGGDVGGEIQVDVPYESGLVCEVTLSSIYSYVTGSGKNRSRSESVKWQDSGYAQVEPAARGMRLGFRFSVPEGLNPSEEETGNYYFWRLNIKAEQPGIDLDRSYTIPVYATAEKSRFQHLDSGRETPQGMPELTAEMLLPLRRNGMVQELYYPMLRQPLLSTLFTVIGGIFAIAGVMLWGKAAQEGMPLYFMGGLFTFLGSMVALAGLYTAFNSLYVAWDGRQVVTIRRLLGITVRWKNVRYHELREIELKKGSTSTQTGNTHKISYHVIAQTQQGKIVLAENLDSHTKAKLVTEFFRKQFKT
ncbi:MAG: DUF3592 domain-containing protein [Candidatus Thiodiazotropha sp.]|nr:DUF3592 domain-containing protein [Candidatus Thiodiazotropha sp. (ex Lucina pensylvanica)]MBT3064450.1 DUF3592 domain-containing protein [Candidatus Thiodiazotropha sp. (ex Lucina pensylvanica)]MBV2095898.1 DUF3592 domain-containing protein [Candidatus Thiodiazotropha sp. (ex Codakia orbicularis)]